MSKEFEVNIDKEGGDIAFITYQMGEQEAKVNTVTSFIGRFL